MKKLILSLLFVAFGTILFTGCEKDKGDPPTLPPYESMAIDFSKMTKDAKSAGELTADTTAWNFFSAALTIGVWNTILTGTLVVPIATYYQAINQTPVYMENKTWQWEFDGTGFASTYHARLTGTIRNNDVKWEMYISKSGIGAFEEFKWFEGTSALDGKSGQWILYVGTYLNEEVLQIDWAKTGDQIGSVKYTYVRESDNILETQQLTKGSYLEYGLTEGDLDAFYTIIYSTRDRSASTNLEVYIEWSTTAYYGRIKAAHYFNNNTDCHCWDSQGYDTVCE
jgi:hypothetical protein